MHNGASCHESQRHAGQRWRDAIHDEEEKALLVDDELALL
jgi:hypothetical protein